MSETTDEASRWSWVTADGKVMTGAKGELMLALRSGKLGPPTLVWRPTWGEWLKASQIAELAGVLPFDQVEPARVARRIAAQVSPPALPVPGSSQPPPAPMRGVPKPSVPPPPPVRGKSQPPPGGAHGQAARPRASVAGARVPTVAGIGPSAAAAAAAAAQARPRGASLLGPPRDQMTNTLPMRAPLPTLGGEEAATLRSTLRPPGAVPPPPRTGVSPTLGGATPRSEEEATPRHASAGSTAQPDTVQDAEPPAPTELRPAIVMPGSGSAPTAEPAFAPASTAAALAPLPPAQHDFDVTLGSTPFESERGPEVPASAGAQLENTVSLPATTKEKPTFEQWLGFDLPKRTRLSLIFFGCALALAALVAFVFIVSRTRNPPTAAAAATEAASALASSAPKGCRLLQPAARLATTVERSVPPVFAEVAHGERVAVGFAPTPKGAAGIIVRLDTLDVERPFEHGGDAATRATVPLVSGGRTTFYVDQADSELTGARTVAEGVTLGFAGADLVRSSGGKKDVLWPGAASDKTTEPHVALTPEGTLVTFRRGGLSGQVLYGWLGKDGRAAGLLAIDAPGVKFSGTPDAAAAGRGGLVAFAGRPNDKADWRIQLANAPQQGKASARSFEAPPGGSGGGNIAPAVAALGDDGWLLQWTEGASGQYQVRLARLSRQLEVLGDTRLVSPKGANAGQGSVFASGSRVLSVFVQTTAGHDELWGASFECF